MDSSEMGAVFLVPLVINVVFILHISIAFMSIIFVIITTKKSNVWCFANQCSGRCFFSSTLFSAEMTPASTTF